MLFGRARDRVGCRFRQVGRVPTKFIIICDLLAIVEERRRRTRLTLRWRWPAGFDAFPATLRRDFARASRSASAHVVEMLALLSRRRRRKWAA